jgi:hypothetical protein
MQSPHITTLEALRELYGPARERALKKEIPALDAHATRFVGLSPFVVLADLGLLERTASGGVLCPYTSMHIDMYLKAA